MEFQQELDLPRFDGKKYTKTLEKVIGQIFREAAREWLRHILSSHFPVETGMAKATLTKLADFLRVAINVTPTRESYRSSLYGGDWVDYSTGRELSSFTFIDDKNSPGTGDFIFIWTTNVLHFWLADYYTIPKYKPPAIVGEIRVEEARGVFLDYVQRKFEERLPDFNEGLTNG